MSKRALIQSIAWLMVALALILTFAGLVARWRVGAPWLETHLVFAPVMALAYALIGALVSVRQPRNPIGWMFVVVGVLAGLTLFAAGNRSPIPLGSDSALAVKLGHWLSLWVWIPTTSLPLTFVLLLFPDGRLPSTRWWPVAWAAGLGTVSFILSVALHPSPPIEPLPLFNPFGLPGATDLLAFLEISSSILLPIGTFGALAGLIMRFRRSQSVEREQLKWLVYGSSMAILIILLLSIWWALRPDDPLAYDLTVGSVWFALTIIVVAAGVAILRHGLYNVDLIINRTLVYGILSAGVIGIYVLLVGTLSTLFQSTGNLLITLLATGLAALLVQPLRMRLQSGVNRFMYGERDDPYTVLAGLSRQLKTTLAPSAVLPNIVEAIARNLKLPYVALALTHGNRLEIAAAYGSVSGEPIQLPLVYQSETVGQLLVAPRAPGEAFTPSERRLLDDIALQAGIAAHAVRLTADLQRSREQLVAAREEERRRLRRDLHDGLGPQLASLTLSIAAARELLRHDVHAADHLLGELSHHAQAAITDIRRIVYDLRPPALDDLGLLLALREQAAAYQQAHLQITIDAPERLPALPAAVEVAAYRIVQEAMTNVVRHSNAQRCVVRLRIDAGLFIEIEDNGRGLPSDRRSGVGLTSIRERTAELGGTLTIDSAPDRGTHLRVCLPLGEERV
jgi:signal transduction histidine kinase